MSLTEKDSTVLITSTQLKETNLIFAEHSKLLNENQLLLKKVENYQELNTNLILSDSIRKQQLSSYEQLSESYLKRIDSLNKDIEKKNKVLLKWKVGSITLSVGVLLLLLFQ